MRKTRGNRALTRALNSMKDTQSEAEKLSFITFHPLLVVAGVLLTLYVIVRGIKRLVEKPNLPGEKGERK